MAITVRINEDNYVSLKQLADKERRSVVAQLDVILDEYFHRDTVGNVTPIENTPLPEKYDPKTLETLGKGKLLGVDAPNSHNPIYQMEKGSVHHTDVSELIQQSVTEGEKQLREMQEARGELECCQHPSRPCKHWQWNVDQAGYVNVLSGRFREAD